MPLITLDETKEYIKEAIEDNNIRRIKQIRKAICLKSAMKCLAINYPAKHALIFIGKYYLGLTERQLAKIFKVDHAIINRIIRRYEK